MLRRIQTYTYIHNVVVDRDEGNMYSNNGDKTWIKLDLETRVVDTLNVTVNYQNI